MKKTIALILCLILAFGCALTLVSCIKDDKDDGKSVPKGDPEEAAEALKTSGFAADVIGPEVLGIDGLEKIVFGMGVKEGTREIEAIYILYFKDKDAVRDARDEIDAFIEEFTEEAEDEGIRVKSGESGNIVWLGTDTALKAASGKKVSGILPIGTGEEAPKPVNMPDSNPDFAAEWLERAGYEVYLEKGDPIIDDAVMENLVATVLGSTENEFEGISIFYFIDEEAAIAAYPILEENYISFGEYANEKGEPFNIEIGIFDNMIWMGTTTAILAAAGEDVQAPVTGDGPEDNPGENLEVFFYFERVMEAFESAGFKVSNFSYEELAEGDDYYYSATFQASLSDSQWIYICLESSADRSEIMYSGMEYACEAFQGILDNAGVNVDLEFGVYANVGYVGDEESIAFLKTLGDNIPTDDKDAAREKLEREGYVVNYNEAIDNGIDVKITATAEGDPSNSLTIYYFEDEYYLLNHYETILIQYNVYKKKFEEEGIEFNYLLGRSGLVVWIGTEEIIDVVS